MEGQGLTRLYGHSEECKHEITHDEEAPSLPEDHRSPVLPNVAASSKRPVGVGPVAVKSKKQYRHQSSHSKRSTKTISTKKASTDVLKFESTETCTEEDQEGPLPEDENDIKSVRSPKGFEIEDVEYPEDEWFLHHIPRWELFTVAVIAIVMAAAIIATTTSIAVIRSNNDDTRSNENGHDSPHVHVGPTYSPSRTLNPQEQFGMIRSTLSRNPVTYNLTLEIPYTLEALEEDDHDDITKPPSVRALSWLIFEDNQDSETELVTRYALAMLYYSMGGDDWTNSNGWLSSQKVCADSEGKGNWFGITCSHRLNPGIMHVSELELSENKLSGELSNSLCLIQSLQSLWLDRNAISGSIDPELFPSMHNLQFLYLQHNQLSGPIPNTFLKNDNNLRKYIVCLVCWDKSLRVSPC